MLRSDAKTRAIQILELLKRRVPGRTRLRGEEYARRGTVSHLDWPGDDLQAKVTGSQEYDVVIRQSPSGLTTTCTCPMGGEGGGACKHVWATLCAVEAMSDRELGAVSATNGAPPVEAPQAIAAPIAVEPEWTAALGRILREVPAAPARTRGMIYGWDLAETVLSGQVAIRVVDGSKSAGRVSLFSPVLDEGPTAADRAVVGLLRACARGASGHRGVSGRSDKVAIPGHEARYLMPALCETGRLHAFVDGVPVGPPLIWGGEVPWRLEIRVDREAPPSTVANGRGFLVRGDAVRPLESAPLIMDCGLLVLDGTVGIGEVAEVWPWIEEFRRTPVLPVPVSQLPGFFETVLEHRGAIPVVIPEGVLRSDVEPHAVARLDVREETKDVLLRVGFRYGTGLVIPGQTLPRVKAVEGWIARQPPAERARCVELLAVADPLGEQRSGADEITFREDRLREVVARLLEAGFEVQADSRPVRQKGAVLVSLRTSQDWLDLEGQVSFDGQTAPLPALLAAARDGSRFVRLNDGTVGLLPENWASQWGLLEALGEASGTGLKFRSSQAWVLDSLIGSQEDTRRDESFADLRQRLVDLGAPTALGASASFSGELRPYQQEGVGWMDHLRRLGYGGCLADDMGLGKTIQVLAFLERQPREDRHPALVVAPRSLVFNWCQEAARFTPKLKVLDLSGADRTERMGEIPHYDLVVTTYGCLRRDIEGLNAHHFRYAILDEAQGIKNPNTQVAKSARLLKADHRFALSGTPVENHLGELWSLFEFLNPGMLGKSRAVARLTPKAGADAHAPERGVLAQSIRPFVLRRTKSQVLDDLPDRSDSVIHCTLEGRQRRDYESVRDHYRKALLDKGQQDGLARMKIQILEALLRLRQIACHQGLVDPTRVNESSAKLDALWPMLEELRQENHKVLLFSQFTSFLNIIQTGLRKDNVPFERLDGKTANRQKRVERFQNDPDCRCFLISLKAGGLGLNLTAADYVILLDPWWNPAVEAQAIDRAHRMGQTRKVFTYRIVAADTIEEKILAMQEEKRQLADALFTEDNAILRGLTIDDLSYLLS